MGYIRHMRGRLTDTEWVKIRRLMAEGWSAPQIARVLNRPSGPALRQQIQRRQAREATVSQTQERHCLSCGTLFPSPHCGVRMCDPCRVDDTSPFEPDEYAGLVSA